MNIYAEGEFVGFKIKLFIQQIKWGYVYRRNDNWSKRKAKDLQF